MTSTQRVVDAQHADALLTWYSANKRDLPWRDAADPYLVLVSEVMLQQTQASRVVPFYRDFIARFPTVESLAAATLSAVLDAWSGLGYNSRAKRLRDAATKISESGWPRTLDGLLELPGVGPYTAAAIACFAMGEAVATADTNARRVISRWRGVALEGAALKRAAAEELRSPAATWNQAIMDLGATICLPTNPGATRAQWSSGAAARPPTDHRDHRVSSPGRHARLGRSGSIVCSPALIPLRLCVKPDSRTSSRKSHRRPRQGRDSRRQRVGGSDAGRLLVALSRRSVPISPRHRRSWQGRTTKAHQKMRQGGGRRQGRRGPAKFCT